MKKKSVRAVKKRWQAAAELTRWARKREAEDNALANRFERELDRPQPVHFDIETAEVRVHLKQRFGAFMRAVTR